MFKGAIFDVDGTVLDSMSVWEDAIKEYLDKLSISADEAELAAEMETMDLKQGCEHLKRKFSLEYSSEKILADIVDTVSDFYRNDVQCKQGVKEYLEFLAQMGVKCTVATAGNSELVTECFERIGILKYFLKIFSCAELDTDKNKPDIYLAASHYMNTPPSDTAVFEDAPHALKSARSAGFKTVGIYDECNTQDAVKENSDVFVKTYSELIQLGEKI